MLQKKCCPIAENKVLGKLLLYWLEQKGSCDRMEYLLAGGLGNMLFDPLSQSLGSTTQVHTVTVAQELVDHVAMMRTR